MKTAKTRTIFIIIIIIFTGILTFLNVLESFAEKKANELILIDPNKTNKRSSQEQRFGPITPLTPPPNEQQKIQEPAQQKIFEMGNEIEYIQKRYNYQIRIRKQIAEEMRLEAENMALPQDVIDLEKSYVESGRADTFFMGDKTIFREEEQYENRIKQALQNWEKRNPPPKAIQMIDKHIEEVWKRAKNGEIDRSYFEKTKERLEQRKDSMPLKNGIQSDGTGLS